MGYRAAWETMALRYIMAVLAVAAWDAMPRGFLRSTRPFSILPRRSKRERVVAGYHCRVCYHALGDLII